MAEKQAARFGAILDDQEAPLSNDLTLVCGRPLPQAIPPGSIDRARQALSVLVVDGFNWPDIAPRLAEVERGDDLTIPGIAPASSAPPNPAAFSQAIYALAHLRELASCGEDELIRENASDPDGTQRLEEYRLREDEVTVVIRRLFAPASGNRPSELWLKFVALAQQDTPPFPLHGFDDGCNEVLYVTGNGKKKPMKYAAFAERVRRIERKATINHD